MGGPVVQGKLWWFASARHQGTYVLIPNTFSNGGEPGLEDAWIRSYVVRGTYQAAPKHKFAFTYQRNYKWKGHEIAFGGQTGLPIFPDVSATKRDPVLYYIAQGKWTAAVTSKLLLEAGYSGNILHYSNNYQDGIRQQRGTAAWYAKTSHLDTLTNGLLARTNAGQSDQYLAPDQHSLTGSVVRDRVAQLQGGRLVGIRQQQLRRRQAVRHRPQWRPVAELSGRHTRQRRLHTGASGQCDRVQLALSRNPQLRANIGLYAQDQWSIDKFTFNLGVRWEYLNEEIPAQDRPAGRFAPAQHFEVVNCEVMPGMTCWRSWSPRLGVAYDLFGNGKTALKASFGKYMTPDVSAFANLFNPVATFTENRTWTDSNGDNIAQDNEIAASSNPNFGRVTGRTLDPNFSREYNQQWSVGVQYEVRPGMSATVNWYRRSLYNTAFSRNRAIDPVADWTRTTIVSPLDGSPIPVFLINQNKATGVTPDLYLTNMTDERLRNNTYTGRLQLPEHAARLLPRLPGWQEAARPGRRGTGEAANQPQDRGAAGPQVGQPLRHLTRHDG